MTEKEKMLAGLPYNSRDTELLERYFKARELLSEINTLNPRLIEEKAELLNELLGNKSPGVWIESPFYCDYGENISIGKNTFVNTNCMFLDDNRIQIGDNGLIAPYVQIYTATHPLKASDRIKSNGTNSTYITTTQPVVIGNNVWIGGNSVIFPGVTIGDNVTIGAGSVVNKNIPSNVLAMGNPCKIIKKLE
ncbi:maltose acetyltransferase [Nonlabens tegetincola]|uniref:sugar O-acetyltransferase n=1 Tax=Nonlabens tegetincola TaxID=323273 RepID=UPI000A208E52|nr:sugar O-acetyltransferase [Nonlabens tegetincola]ARN71086.1 maltose acetyltransferase [Nonlabens tegetincola]